MASSNKPADPVTGAVRQVLGQHVGPGQQVMVALSGGVDSVVLLDVLRHRQADFGFRLSALHVNHQLQAGAPDWAFFCQTLCARWQVPLVVETVEITRRPGQSLEAQARHARYRAYQAQATDWLVLAHHQDDQAETVLLQLLRGAGVRGLQAMPASRALATGLRLLRPLLSVTRPDLLVYAQTQGLTWVEDPSNQDTRFARNFLRQRVTPLFDEGFPAWRTTLSRSAEHLAVAQRLMDERAEKDFEICRQGEGLDGQRLQRLTPDRGINLLRWWVHRAGAPSCSQARWVDWWRQCAAPTDRHPRLSWGGWSVYRQRGVWYLSQPMDWEG